MLILTHTETVDAITPVPTAHAISVALSASPYMDHVVDIWIEAWANLKVAQAISGYVNAAKPSTGDVFLDAYNYEETPELVTAKAEFDTAYQEVQKRWTEYKTKA